MPFDCPPPEISLYHRESTDETLLTAAQLMQFFCRSASAPPSLGTTPESNPHSPRPITPTAIPKEFVPTLELPPSALKCPVITLESDLCSDEIIRTESAPINLQNLTPSKRSVSPEKPELSDGSYISENSSPYLVKFTPNTEEKEFKNPICPNIKIIPFLEKFVIFFTCLYNVDRKYKKTFLDILKNVNLYHPLSAEVMIKAAIYWVKLHDIPDFHKKISNKSSLTYTIISVLCLSDKNNGTDEYDVSTKQWADLTGTDVSELIQYEAKTWISLDLDLSVPIEEYLNFNEYFDNCTFINSSPSL